MYFTLLDILLYTIYIITNQVYYFTIIDILSLI